MPATTSDAGMMIADDGGAVPADDAGAIDDTDAGSMADAGPPVPTFAITLRTTEGWGHGTLAIEGHGAPCEGECTVDVPQGEEITIVATPGVGQAISGWTEACETIAVEDRCTLVADADRAVGAWFTGGRGLGAFTLGGTGSQDGVDVAFAPDGDLVVTGWFTGPLTVAGRSPEVSYAGDTYVARFSGDGATLRWLVRTRGAGSEMPTGIAVDAEGAAYVVGTFGSQLSLGTTTITAGAGYEAWAARIDADGSVRWVIQIDEGAQVLDVVAGRGGIVHAIGGAHANTMLYAIAPDDGSVEPIDLGGTGGADIGRAIAYAPDGDLFVAGSVTGGFGPTNTIHVDAATGYVARVSTIGGVAWAQTLGGAGANEWLQELASTPDGRVFVAWYFDGSTILPGRATPTTSAGTDWAISSFDALGAARWSRSGGGATRDLALGIAVGPDGALYVVGLVDGTGASPVGTIVAEGGDDDGWLVRLDDAASGASFVTHLASSDDLDARAVAVSADHVAVTGFVQGTSRLGMPAPTPAITAEGSDGFVYLGGR